MDTFVSLGLVSALLPHISTYPDVLLIKPDKIPMRVDFPAPFVPSNPKIVPFSISKSIPYKARVVWLALLFL